LQKKGLSGVESTWVSKDIYRSGTSKNSGRKKPRMKGGRGGATHKTVGTLRVNPRLLGQKKAKGGNRRLVEKMGAGIFGREGKKGQFEERTNLRRMIKMGS